MKLTYFFVMYNSFIYKIIQNISDVLWLMFPNGGNVFLIQFLYLSVRLSVKALIVINILQLSLNLYMLFTYYVESTVLKMICMD